MLEIEPEKLKPEPVASVSLEEMLETTKELEAKIA
jgi:hypothetical protein